MINISELHDDLLLKILSFLPTKDVVATSVLSKPWLYLWEQRKLLHDDVDIVVICPRCSPYWIVITCVLDPSRKYYTEGDEDPSSQRRLASLLTRLKADLCTDCYRRTLAAKKLITIFILEFGTPNRYQAFIWTKLEKKQQMEIESVCLRDTNLCYCLSLI